MMKGFNYKGWKLFDAIDALMAYDEGASDSGVHEESMRTAVADYLGSLDESAYRITCAEFARNILTDESLAQGYGLDDVRNFIEWLSSLGVASRQ